MESRYIEQKPLPPFDSQVSNFVEGQEIDGGGNDMIIGIENHNGDVYRIIQATGMGEYMGTVNFLGSIGLEDILADSLFGAAGFDSQFVVPTNLRQELERGIEVADPSFSDPLADITGAEPEFDSLSVTEREAIVQSRLGQGVFRSQLIQYWGECAVTGCRFVQILRASHIKPWRSSSNAERLDTYNGLLLVPNLDAAFDIGLVTFDTDGRIVVSKRISQQVAYTLHLGKKLRINKNKLTDEHKSYLDYHRENVYQEA